MRSHAKASSAGSTQGRGKSQGSFVRGGGASRGTFSDADGSRAPSHRARLLALSLSGALLAFALLATSAFASKEVISGFGTFAESGSFGGELSNPRGVSVDGTVYVADEANNRIERFLPNGSFVSAWGKDVIASSINERQRLVLRETTGGTYTLSFDGSTTEPINPSGDVRAALAALPTIGGSANIGVSGQGTATNPYVVTFKGALAAVNQPTLTVDASEMDGSAEISTIANGAPTVADDTGVGFEVCTVAIECKAGVASGQNGALSAPQAVAADPDTGNVYVSDRGNRRIDEFDGSGGFIRTFGFDVAEAGPGNTGTEYEVCSQGEGDTCKSGEGGSGSGQYGGGEIGGFGIAVSPADGNASTGTVYLADSGNRRVDTFHLDGTSPASFGSSANFGEEQPRSIAVDSRGIVYASDSNNGGDVQRYDSANVDSGGVGFLAPIVPPSNETQKVSFSAFSTGDSYRLTCPDGTPSEELTYTTGQGSLGQPIGEQILENGLKGACGAANVSFSGEPPNTTVTFVGSLAAADQPEMTCTVLSGSGSCSVSTIADGRPGPLLPGQASATTVGIAVNPAGTALYILRDPSSGPTVVQQLGPVNEPGLAAAPTGVDDTHGSAAGFEEAVRGLAFDSASGRLYLSVNGDPDGFKGALTVAHRIYVLAESPALPSPTASLAFSGGAVSAIGDRGAVFHGTVDPQGGLVSCKFQYSIDEINWSDVGASACAALSQNGGPQNVKQGVSSLLPNQKYFVRLQVIRPYFASLSPVTSEVRSFTTASAPPVLSDVSGRALDEHSVRVAATVDPSHSPTSVVVQYGTSPSLGSSTAPVQIGGGTVPVEISPVIIIGLTPNTQYYFRLIATNLVGSTASGSLPIATFSSPQSFGSCPNDRLRTGFSVKLPDCRAYEQVTPTDKTGADAFGSPNSVEASPSGDGINFFTFAGFPGAESFQEYNVFQSHFTGSMWSTAGLNLSPSLGERGNIKAWTPDLRFTLVTELSLTDGYSMFIRDGADESATVVVPPGVGFEPSRRAVPELGGTFDGDSTIVFQANGSVPTTVGPSTAFRKNNSVYLYDRETGELALAGLLPDSACAAPPCVPPRGSELAKAFESYVLEGHSVSSNGDVYFTDTASKQLYVRREAANPDAATVQVSASERTDCADHDPCGSIPEPDPAGTFTPTFMGAIPDGSQAFFRSAEKLTDNSTATTGAEDLYRFEPNAPSGQRLTDLVPGADLAGVLGYSDDGGSIYFAANADLDGAGPAASGDCGGSATNFEEGFVGSCSVYLWQADGAGKCTAVEGCITFVVRIDAAQSPGNEGDGYNWGGDSVGSARASRVSADGRALVFRSRRRVTTYDNYGPHCVVQSGQTIAGNCSEFYRYDAESGEITCVTCDPSGVPPAGSPDLKNPDMFHGLGSHATFSAEPFLSRNLSPDGNRFFFETPDKLVPSDINGEQVCPEGVDPATGTGINTWACTDVYEWEAPGIGSCIEGGPAYSSANAGCIYLLSTGTGAYPSYLADVSESGDTAFIFSRQQLTPSDEDTQEDIYAVKVDGGLDYQHVTRRADCEGDGCRERPSQPSDAPGAGSAAFEGPGNPKANTNSTRCPKGKREVRSKGKVRCVAKKHGHKKLKRHRRRAANNDRRAS